MIAMGGSSRAAEAESGRLYEVSRPDGADERAASRAASGSFGPGHRPATGPTDQVRVPPVVDQVLAAGGTPLDAATRGVMEPRLGHNLADVRIHAGPDAGLAARSLQARAFTAGSHVVLGASAPPTASPAGARLLAHELTHVVQGRHDGEQPVLRRAVELPETAMAEEKKLRIYRKLGEFAAEVPADAAQSGPAPAMPTSPDAAPATGAEPQSDPSLDLARQIASYLVVTEDLAPADLDAVLMDLAEADPGLLSAVALGGRLFRALAELGVSTAAAAGWYVLLTIRDTLAGDFVADPTALAIVIRTLLTLIPGVDTAADVEDLVADLILGALHPQEKLLSVGWWFAIAITLAGLFPEFGSAVKGTVQLTVKGIGQAGRAGLEALAPLLRRLMGDGWMDLAKAGLGELLDTAATWGPWVRRSFGELVDLALDYLGRAASAVGGALLEALIDAFRRMKELAPEWLEKAIEDVVAALRRTDDEIARSADDLDEITEVIARGRKLDPSQVEQTVTDELTRLSSTAGRPITTASEDAARALARVAPELVNDVTRQTDKIAEAFANPAAFGAAMRKLQQQVADLTEAEISAEVERLTKAGLVTPLQRETAAYAAAVRKLAADRGTGMVEIVPDAAKGVAKLVRDSGEKEIEAVGGVLSHDQFMNDVIRTGDMIVDYAFLDDPHSALTHVVQDLVADEALKAAGYLKGVVGYRALLGQLNDVGKSAGLVLTQSNLPETFSAGTAFWVATFDTVGGIAQPEKLGPILRGALNVPPEAKAL